MTMKQRMENLKNDNSQLLSNIKNYVRQSISAVLMCVCMGVGNSIRRIQREASEASAEREEFALSWVKLTQYRLQKEKAAGH